MRIRSLRLIDFRNYRDKTFQFHSNITVFCGTNGIGKTNIIEAIYMSSIGKSHRVTEDAYCIRFHQDISSLTLQFDKQDVPHTLFLKIPRKGRKEIVFNDNKILQKELIGTLQTVLFSPEDLHIIKGSPVERRKFLDREISQTSPSYYQALQSYNKALKQRNRLLKEYAYKNRCSLEEWDRQLAKYASIIIKKRLQSLEKMTMLTNLMHRKLTEGKENIRLRYVQPYSFNAYVTEEEALYQLYKDNEAVDRKKMTTSVGPHRDDIIFLGDYGDIKYFGSQGQQRTAILALKLSELEFIKSEIGEYPILLLDDVCSELDITRRQQLLQFIQKRVQTFITTTDISEFEHMQGVSIVDMKGI